MNPIEQLKTEQKKYISIEDVLSFIQKKYNYSLFEAAEVLLHLLPAQERDINGNLLNPPFFYQKSGIATFTYSRCRPDVYQMLKDIISNRSCAFKEPIIEELDDCPF